MQQHKQRTKAARKDEEVQEETVEVQASTVAEDADTLIDEIDALLDLAAPVELPELEDLLGLPEMDPAEQEALEKEIQEEAETDRLVAELVAEAEQEAKQDAAEAQRKADAQEQNQNLCPCGRTPQNCTSGLIAALMKAMG